MINIRLANHDDVDNIATIHCQSWEQAYHHLLPEAYIDANNNLSDKAAMWAQVVSHANTTTLIAYDVRQRDLGFISYYQQGNKGDCDQAEFEITTLYVLPESQGIGVGAALISAALKSMRQVHPRALVSLWVLQTNLSAIGFYRRQGFTITAEQEVEIFDFTKIIDIKMIRELS